MGGEERSNEVDFGRVGETEKHFNYFTTKGHNYM